MLLIVYFFSETSEKVVAKSFMNKFFFKVFFILVFLTSIIMSSIDKGVNLESSEHVNKHGWSHLIGKKGEEKEIAKTLSIP
jgi:hypothetical protein